MPRISNTKRSRTTQRAKSSDHFCPRCGQALGKRERRKSVSYKNVVRDFAILAILALSVLVSFQILAGAL